jgi:hypothetical protein
MKIETEQKQKKKPLTYKAKIENQTRHFSSSLGLAIITFPSIQLSIFFCLTKKHLFILQNLRESARYMFWLLSKFSL